MSRKYYVASCLFTARFPKTSLAIQRYIGNFPEIETVRRLLERMNIVFLETAENRAQSEFCGSTLYREQPTRNAKFAPRHYVEQAQGKFLPHTQEEQVAIMRAHCSQYRTETVVCYCHYCLEGLLQGGVDGRHIAHFLFPT